LIVSVLLAITVGVLVAAAVYLMLSRNLVRFIFGLALASNAVNLLIFSTGQVARYGSDPPLIPADQKTLGHAVANALPQALVLTAIVIGFALLTFVFVLFYRAGEALGTVNTEDMRAAETPVGAAERDRRRAPRTRRRGPQSGGPSGHGSSGASRRRPGRPRTGGRS
jgi:multicomponent Na+:H+ antiporter subunit C